MAGKRLKILFALILLAGCSTAPTETEYYVEATVVSTPPENATVIDELDTRIQDLTPIQKVLSDSNNTTLQISESEYEAVEDRFEQLPVYSYSGDYGSYDVLYVRTGNSTKRVRLYQNTLV